LISAAQVACLSYALRIAKLIAINGFYFAHYFCLPGAMETTYCPI